MTAQAKLGDWDNYRRHCECGWIGGRHEDHPLITIAELLDNAHYIKLKP